MKVIQAVIEAGTSAKQDQLIHDFTSFELAELDYGKDDKGNPKREIVLTCLQEGPGNLADRRWYTAAAVEGLEKKIWARKKIFTDHLITEEQQSRGDSLRDWDATILKTWLDTKEDGRVARKVRLKIHEDWLWRRCEDAPGEIALSIEGGGLGRKGKVNGEDYTIIEAIHTLNAFKFVPYPGNADMGADLVEGEAAEPTQEEQSMDLSKLTEKELRDNRADLVEAITQAVMAEAEKQNASKLDEAVKTAVKKAEEDASAVLESKVAEAVKAADDKTKQAEDKAKMAEQAKDGDVKSITDQFRQELKDALAEQAKTLGSLKDENEALKQRLDEKEVREKLISKESMIDRLIEASELPAEAKTPLFKSGLMRLTERKDGDKVVTVEDQAKELIEDRKKLCAGGEAVVNESGADTGIAKAEPKDEEEKQVVIDEAFGRKYSREFGMDLTPDTVLVEYRKRKDAAEKK